jgi:hypothetical protein
VDKNQKNQKKSKKALDKRPYQYVYLVYNNLKIGNYEMENYE